MALADVYDALRSKRPYKEPFTHKMSLEIIVEGIGHHFDPEIAAAFLTVEADFDRIRGQMENQAR